MTGQLVWTVTCLGRGESLVLWRLGGISVKSMGKNYLKILLVVLLSGGLIYAFYNVLSSRVQSRENLKHMESVTGSVLKSMDRAERMECRTSVYLNLDSEEEEDKHDKSQDINLIHDFGHRRLYIGRGDRTEIMDYRDKPLYIYSRGISPIYSKTDVQMKMVLKNQWYRYAAESMYGIQWKEGKSDQISYGYLRDKNFLVKIAKQGQDTIDEKSCTKYKAVIKNSLRDRLAGKESDNEFRKTLSTYGLNVMDLKKGYPDVYKMLKDTYNQDTEEMYIWTDENGNMVRIEKDHTFRYYLNVMKENSEKIEEKVGQYGYPRVYCRQSFKYSPACGIVEIPKDFEEL